VKLEKEMFGYMFQFETANELFLKVSCDGQGHLFTKAGAFVGGQGNFKFEKVLLGPQGNPMQALLGQAMRRLSGENLPLMKVNPQGQYQLMFANLAQHVIPLDLSSGMSITIESENILAFTDTCKYSVKFMGQGVVSQKGLFTSILTGQGQGAFCAILVDGNPLVLDTPCFCDPDAHVAHIGADPGFKFDVGWKNLIGQASGETYMFHFQQPGGKVIIQPSERKSGIDIGIDGKGGKPVEQNNQLFRADGNQALQGMGQVAGQLGQSAGLGNVLGNGNNNNGGGLGSILGNLLRS